MAVINLQHSQFQYDDATNELIVTLTEAPPDDDPDPASWVPSFVRVVKIQLPSAPDRNAI